MPLIDTFMALPEGWRWYLAGIPLVFCVSMAFSLQNMKVPVVRTTLINLFSSLAWPLMLILTILAAFGEE